MGSTFVSIASLVSSATSCSSLGRPPALPLWPEMNCPRLLRIDHTHIFVTGHEMTYEISERTPYGIINIEPLIGRTYSFWINEKTVNKPFYTYTISTPLETEIRTGFCNKFG